MYIFIYIYLYIFIFIYLYIFIFIYLYIFIYITRLASNEIISPSKYIGKWVRLRTYQHPCMSCSSGNSRRRSVVVTSRCITIRSYLTVNTMPPLQSSYR